MIEKLTHFDTRGRAVMVDVTAKQETSRTAIAKGRIRVSADTMTAIREGSAAKGDVLGVARVAGIMAVKRTSDLIPMCHPLAVTGTAVDFDVLPDDDGSGKVVATCPATVTGNTGVEMEALTGVTTALLTIYDLCQALDRAMTNSDVHLVRQEGGKSGVFVNER